MQLQDYASSYQSKSDEELRLLALDRDDLIPEARLALEGELTRRKLALEESPSNIHPKNEEPESATPLAKIPRGRQTAGEFLAEALDLYHHQFWFFFKLTIPVVALSWLIFYVTSREIQRMLQDYIGSFGRGDRSAEIFEMYLLRLGQFLFSWIAFACVFAVICSATREIVSGATPNVSDSLNAVRAQVGRFLRLSFLLFGLALVAVAASGLATKGLFFAVNRFHFHGPLLVIIEYTVTGLVFLVLSRFALAIPATILDGYGVSKAVFRSDELTEGQWFVLAALLAKSVIGGYIAGMSPFWLARLLPLPLPVWFHSALSALSIAAVSAVEPVMFIGFALLYIRMSAAQSAMGSLDAALQTRNQPA